MNDTGSGQSRFRRRGRRLALLAALAGALATGGGCARSQATATPPPARPVTVAMAPVTYSEAAVPVRASGVLSRKTEADLAFKIGGVVEAVLVRVGDAVEKDQVLARLRLDEIEAQLAQARAAVEKAQRDLRRAQQLDAQGAVAAEVLQDARTGFEQASAQLRIAEFNRRYAVIAAPAAGRILRRLAEPDELVAAGRAILSFASDADGWLVRAGLPERDLRRVQRGDVASVTTGAGEGGPVRGRVTSISEAVDAATRTTQIEIALEQPPAGARSGFVVAVQIEPQPVAPRPVVPATALVEGAEGRASLFVVAPGDSTARRLAVEVESLFGTQAYLRTALPRDARLVVSGAEYLREGSLVAATP